MPLLMHRCSLSISPLAEKGSTIVVGPINSDKEKTIFSCIYRIIHNESVAKLQKIVMFYHDKNLGLHISNIILPNHGKVSCSLSR